MTPVCILTDSSIQFPRPGFPGCEHVRIIPCDLRSTTHLSPEMPEGMFDPRSLQAFSSYFTQMNQEYGEILVITPAASLSQMRRYSGEAIAQYANHATIQVIDSLTTSIGLGLLVQIAAEAAAAGLQLHEIEHLVRLAIPRIYMLFCIPEMNYLAEAGYLSRSQAAVGEMMGLLPIFVLEEGHLTPMLKVRTQRHLLESFQEFIDEFSDPFHVALIQAANNMHLRVHPLREYIEDSFPSTPFSVHSIGAHLSGLFGPQCVGLVVMEKSNSRS